MQILEINNDKYPKTLKKINNPPEKLFIEGNSEVLNMNAVTVVGSRNMTNYGRQVTKKLVAELCKFNICIVSGLAIGIDSVAHSTCLENGGKTIAVLGSGLNNVYPRENKNLFNRIINSGGCVISEYEPDVEANKSFFPARNRIVSGLSLGTLVVEATYRSGTSITAKFAREQGKKVFCIPNSVGNKNSSGTINLIKRGAILVTSAEEIMYELGLTNTLVDIDRVNQKRKEIIEQQEISELDANTRKMYLYIKENKIVNLDNICNHFNESIQEVYTHLSILELKGIIVNRAGDKYELRDEFNV